jgi:hypothetical protein
MRRSSEGFASVGDVWLGSDSAQKLSSMSWGEIGERVKPLMKGLRDFYVSPK